MRKQDRVWQIVYPIGIYYVVSSVVFFVLEWLLGTENETYMIRQTASAAVAIPFLWPFYARDKKPVADRMAAHLWNILLSALTAAALGIALNNIIAMTPLMEASGGFAEANEAFFGGGVAFELLGSCLVIPLAEELLYRGIVYQRLRLWLGVPYAMVLSALIFGLVHVNLVQFLYAGILGLLLAFLLERTGHLYAAVAGHIAANLAAVARQETGFLSFSYERTAAGLGFTAAMLLLAAAGVGVLLKGRGRKGQRKTVTGKKRGRNGNEEI